MNALVLYSLIAGAAPAPAPSLVPPAGPGAWALTGATVLTGDGQPAQKINLVVSGDRLGKPNGAVAAGRTVEANGLFITPGFVEARTQIGLFEVSAERSTVDIYLEGTSVRPAFRARDGFNPTSTHLAIARNGGVTSAVLSPEGGLVSGTGVVLTLSPEPSLRDTEAAMFADVTDGVRAQHGQSRGGVWLAWRRLVDDAGVYRTNRRGYEQGNLAPLATSRLHLEAFLPVLQGRLPLVVTADKASDIEAWLRAREELAAQGDKLDLVIASGAEAWRVADRLAAAQVPVILTPSAQDPHSFDALYARDDAATLLHQAGVPLIISSATWANNVRRIRHEAGLAVAHGLPPEAALAAISKTPAERFGLDDRGVLAAGRRADFVVWDGDPFEVTTRPVAVFVGGTPVPLVDRQRALGKKYMNR